MNRFFSIRMPFNSPDDFGGGGTPSPAASDISAPATQTASPTAQTPDPTGTPNGTPHSAATQQAQPEPSWLRGRLQETRDAAVRQARQQFDTELANERAQRDAIQRQLHALVGVTPQEDPEVATIRAQFNKLYPGLAKLEAQADDLLSLREARGDIDAVSQHHWARYGQQTMDRLYSAAEKSIGGPLSDTAKQTLHAAFSGYVQSSPEAANRYATDPTFADEFWNMWSSSFIDPVRRSATAQVPSTPQRLPQDTPAGIPSMQSPQKPGSIDERAANAWASYQAHRTRQTP